MNARHAVLLEFLTTKLPPLLAIDLANDMIHDRNYAGWSLTRLIERAELRAGRIVYPLVLETALRARVEELLVDWLRDRREARAILIKANQSGSIHGPHGDKSVRHLFDCNDGPGLEAMIRLANASGHRGVHDYCQLDEAINNMNQSLWREYPDFDRAIALLNDEITKMVGTSAEDRFLTQMEYSS